MKPSLLIVVAGVAWLAYDYWQHQKSCQISIVGSGSGGAALNVQLNDPNCASNYKPNIGPILVIGSGLAITAAG